MEPNWRKKELHLLMQFFVQTGAAFSLKQKRCCELLFRNECNRKAFRQILGISPDIASNNS